MKKHSIKHIWFDFSDTLAVLKKEEHDKLRYESYASVFGKTVTPELVQEYETLYQQHKSNAAVFSSLGFPSGYWSERVNSANPGTLYRLADKNIPDTLTKLREIVPISIFSNIRLENLLPALGLDPEWFEHILSSADVKNPKPALDGFYKMIELSELPPQNLLYIGDSVSKDSVPAKRVGIITGLVWDTSSEADYSFKNFQEILKTFQS